MDSLQIWDNGEESPSIGISYVEMMGRSQLDGQSSVDSSENRGNQQNMEHLRRCLV